MGCSPRRSSDWRNLYPGNCVAACHYLTAWLQLRPGTRPLPYRLQLRVELVECERPNAIDATISGDLIGDARLRLRPEVGGTWAEVAWTLEMRQPAMRLASRIGHPVLQWGHDRVVEITVAGFRRRVKGS